MSEIEIEKNVLFPGRDNYEGPESGNFAFVHHRELYERSHSITERVNFIWSEKPKHERAIRLYNLMYLGNCPVIQLREAAEAEHRKKVDERQSQLQQDRHLLNVAYDVARTAMLVKRIRLIASGRLDSEKTIADLDVKIDTLAKVRSCVAQVVDQNFNVDFNKFYTEHQNSCSANPINDAVLAYVMEHIPDCAWNGTELVFPKRDFTSWP